MCTARPPSPDEEEVRELAPAADGSERRGFRPSRCETMPSPARLLPTMSRPLRLRLAPERLIATNHSSGASFMNSRANSGERQQGWLNPNLR